MKCLVACPHRLLLVDLDSGKIGVVEAHRQEYYGISWTRDGQRLCLSHSGLDNAALGTMESYLDAEQGWLSLGGQSSPRCLAGPHQVLCLDGQVVATNTGRNCLTVFQPDNLFYQNRWLDRVRWDRKGRQHNCGSHFNSLFFRDDCLYILAHNFDKGSYVLVLSWPDLQVLDRIDTGAQHSHNLWPWPGGEILLCNSTSGSLLEARSGHVFWQMDGVLTRGLACSGRHVLIAGSAITTVAERPVSDSCIFIVDRRDWKLLDVFHLPGAGVIHEIRIIDRADECHHGQPLHVVPPVDPVATARFFHTRRKLRSIPPFDGRGGHAPTSRTAATAVSQDAGSSLPELRNQRQPDLRPLRIGIWPDYGYEVEPDATDAVRIYGLSRDFDSFVRHLGERLAATEAAVDLVLLDRNHYKSLEKATRARPHAVRLTPASNWLHGLQPSIYRFTESWLRWSGRRSGCLRIRRRLRDIVGPYWDLFGRAHPGAILAGLVLFPVVFLLLWSVFALWQVVGGLSRTFLFPFQFWHRAVLRGRRAIRQSTLKRAHAAACDAWLLPALRRGAGEDWVEKVEWGRSDLQLLLPAAPADFPAMNHQLFQCFRPAALTRPYLFVPGPVLPGPFLDALPAALDLLNDEPLEVVFAEVEGDRSLPSDDRLHLIPCADPRARAALYRGAAAAVLPTLDLETVTTIGEALHWGCPLIAAGVPALLPWLKVFGDTVALFDPAYPESLGRAVRQTREDRDWTHSLQKEAGKTLRQRTWTDAAREVLLLARRSPATAPPLVQGEPTRSYFQTASGR